MSRHLGIAPGGCCDRGDDITIACPASLAEKDQPIYRAADACRADVLLSGDLPDFGPFMNHQRRNRPTHCPAGDLSSGPSAPATQALLHLSYTTWRDAARLETLVVASSITITGLAGLEPTTYGLGNRRSIRLSYSPTGIHYSTLGSREAHH